MSRRSAEMLCSTWPSIIIGPVTASVLAARGGRSAAARGAAVAAAGCLRIVAALAPAALGRRGTWNSEQ
eukprot:206326-Chlamydomonas_euryale.AAC.4